MRVKFWGARGSCPVSGPQYALFGGHTPCLEVTGLGVPLLIDLGTGVVQAAHGLGQGDGRGQAREIEVLLSHFHHDHIAGLPFLMFGLPEDMRLRIHVALGDGRGWELLKSVFSPPYFPASAGRLFDRITVETHEFGETFAVGSGRVTTCPLEHPGGSTAFRIENGQGTLLYASDLSLASEPSDALVALSRGADLLVQDTMVEMADLPAAASWGHSTIELAIALAERAGIRAIAGFHHQPRHDDAQMLRREADLKALRPESFFAREGMEISIPG